MVYGDFAPSGKSPFAFLPQRYVNFFHRAPASVIEVPSDVEALAVTVQPAWQREAIILNCIIITAQDTREP
ncbi:hypothetical protein WDV93_20695 [Pantoea ananatis]